MNPSHLKLVPMPVQVQLLSGVFTASSAAVGDAGFTISGEDNYGEEGYALRVEPGGIRKSASTPAGFFYAAQTLLQLQSAEGPVPCVSIQDQPRHK